MDTINEYDTGERREKEFCSKCDYCSDGSIYKRCINCKKCFCEWHAGEWGFCYKCRPIKKEENIIK